MLCYTIFRKAGENNVREVLLITVCFFTISSIFCVTNGNCGAKTKRDRTFIGEITKIETEKKEITIVYVKKNGLKETIIFTAEERILKNFVNGSKVEVLLNDNMTKAIEVKPIKQLKKFSKERR
jgi:hypothetical protein